MLRRINYLLIITIALLALNNVSAQHTPSEERGDPNWRAQGQMEGNRIRTTVFNNIHTGRLTGEVPINEQTPYEWPKNTGKVYLALQNLWVGAEVVDDEGETRPIVVVPSYRQSPEGKSWNFEPVPGYYNRDVNEVANSLNPETWPDSWPDRLGDSTDPGWSGAWNGYFGKNVFQADQEIFFRASDDRYDRYPYYPDSTDLTRKGLGIKVDVRVLAWSQVLVQDVVYILHTMKNDGTKDLDKVAITLWFADFVGGDGDSQDDISEFLLDEDILWARDQDHQALNFGSDPVGAVGVTFLETPGNAVDRVDNDGDSPESELGPRVTEDMIESGDLRRNLKDDNGNGLIDENDAHVEQGGVTYADRIDNNDDGEDNSPTITATMISDVQSDKWKRWPPNPENDPFLNGDTIVHLIMVDDPDLDKKYADFIDNDGDGEDGNPAITQAMIDQASTDTYKRYKVPGTDIILYGVEQDDLGKKYADGIDNDNDVAVDEGIDEFIDEMVDESRGDGIDNDGDWDPLRDDVGLDGVEGTGDEGEGDGVPTVGRRGLPGEPNTDVTDVSETDIIGLTGTNRLAAGELNILNDFSLFNNFMIPGRFGFTTAQAGEYDLFTSSGFFPMEAGQTEPISIAVMLVNSNNVEAGITGGGATAREEAMLRLKSRAQETYNNDYQFAQAPLTPTLTAVAGDGKVFLSWDGIAESSFDTYIDGIGGDGFDFEGYRIYRASDPAFSDAETITDAYGTPKFKDPLAIFDLNNGINGLFEVTFDGVSYQMGDDSGLKHTYVDSSAMNGFTYYYAVVAYDRGYIPGGIIPSESPIRISSQADGSVELGKNVAKVTPEAPVAGYIEPTLGNIEHVSGTSNGTISYNIVDIFSLQDGHEYYITFEDTIIPGPGGTDTLTTKNFTLIDSTDREILIDKSREFGVGGDAPVIEGFQLSFANPERVQINEELSVWSDNTIIPFVFGRYSDLRGNRGERRPNDYEIQFGNLGIDTSRQFVYGNIPFNTTYPAIPVNFKVYNKSTGNYLEFGFMEIYKGTEGAGIFNANPDNLTKKDRIVFFEPNQQDSLIFTWWFYLADQYPDTVTTYRMPTNGDRATIQLDKPFLSEDVYRFTVSGTAVDNEQAKADLENIKVVPNPYLANADWEPKNPYTTGRGPRELHFTHLPQKCTIRIFTINGELVDIIEHDSMVNDGTANWDMLSMDNLKVAYGVYIFHVEAPGIGEKTGKFALIK